MLEIARAGGILSNSRIWTLACQQSCLRSIIAPRAIGRDSLPSKSWHLLPRFLKMWLRTGWRNKLSGRSTCLLHGTYRDLSLMSGCQTRSIKLTSFSFRTTAWDGGLISMLSRSWTSPAATRKLSLWLARAQQRSPMPCLVSTYEGLWSGPSFFRLTLDVNLWGQLANSLLSTGSRSGAAELISTGTKEL